MQFQSLLEKYTRIQCGTLEYQRHYRVNAKRKYKGSAKLLQMMRQRILTNGWQIFFGKFAGILFRQDTLMTFSKIIKQLSHF